MTGEELNKPKPTVLLFDMDGTLVDNSDVVVDAYYNGMIKLGYQPMKKENIKKLFGRSTYETGRGLGLKHKDLPRIDSFFWEYFGNYAETLEGKPAIYPGIPQLLKYLYSKNIKMGIVTSNESKSARLLMQKGDLNHFFEVYIGSEDLPQRKPSPEPLYLALKKMKVDIDLDSDMRDLVWFVGDTKYDVEAAHNARVYSVGVSQEGTGELMLNAGPHLIVDNISELYHTVKSMWN